MMSIYQEAFYLYLIQNLLNMNNNSLNFINLKNYIYNHNFEKNYLIMFKNLQKIIMQK